MLDLGISDLETLYQALLDEYRALEAETSLTPAVAMALGGREFERQLCQTWSAGQYSPTWLERMNRFSAKLAELCAQVETSPGDLWHDRLLKLQDDGEQINPAVVMRRMRADATPLGNPDTVADQLAQGATLCELF